MSALSAKSYLDPLRNMLATGKVKEALQAVARFGSVSLAGVLKNQRFAFTTSTDNSFATETRGEIGCLIKNLTAVLFALAASDGKLTYDTRVSEFFPEIPGVDPSLKIYHLLNQSHGLDGSSMIRMPRTDGGFIDVATIWSAMLAVRPLSPPGSVFYQYGVAGMWLAGSILERIYQDKFPTLLRNKVLKPIGADQDIDDGRMVCPAAGGVCLSADDLMGLCELHLESSCEMQRCSAIESLRREKYGVKLEKWPWIADSSGPGWYTYGPLHGNFGIGNKFAALILVSPGQSAFVALTASNKQVLQLAQRRLFPFMLGGGGTRPPRPLTRSEREQFDQSQVLGRYEKATLTLDIRNTEDGQLQAALYRRRPGSELSDVPDVTRVLLPAVDETYYATPPDLKGLAYVKFREQRPEGDFMYAMTGRHLFRRTS